MSRLLSRAVIAVVALAGAAEAAPVDYAAPASVELRTFRIKDFAFAGGRTASIKLGYRTLGTPHKGGDGQVDNAVVLLHGTGGSGAAFLGPKPRCCSDRARRSTSPAPSSSCPMRSAPAARASRATCSGSIFRTTTIPTWSAPPGRWSSVNSGVAHPRLIVGCRWARCSAGPGRRHFPTTSARSSRSGAWPQALGGRNLLWRLAARDALLANSLSGGAGARVAAAITMVANVPSALLARRVPDAGAARSAVDAAIAGAPEPVDLAFQLDAVRTYAPQAKLEAIRAKVVALNFADDVLYPPDADPLPAATRRNPRIAAVTVPASPATSGHATLGAPAVWLPYVEPAIRAALAR